MRIFQSFFEKSHKKILERSYNKVHMVAKYITPDDLGLDAGCGEKSLVKKWQPNMKLTVGIDMWEESISKNKDLGFLAVADVEKIPFKNETFDFVFCVGLMEHVEHPEIIYKEFHRVLKRNGKLIVMTNSIYNPFMVINRMFSIKIRNKIKDAFRIPYDHAFPAPYRCNTIRKLNRVLTNQGFEKADVWRMGRPLVDPQHPLYLMFWLYEKITDFKLFEGAKRVFQVCYIKK